MVLKKENNQNDSLMSQAYNSYGMRNKLKDIENKINSVERTQRSNNSIIGGKKKIQ